jgi:hypothetical protein
LRNVSLDEQEKLLTEEISENQKRLDTIDGIKRVVSPEEKGQKIFKKTQNHPRQSP